MTGGQTREQHWLRVCSVLTDIDRELAANIHAGLDPNEDAARLLLEFIVELYLLRTSERMSPTAASSSRSSIRPGRTSASRMQ